MKHEEICRAFGLALRSLRDRLQLSQEDLRGEGLNRGHVSKMEQGEIDPGLTTLVRLSAAMHIPWKTLTDEIDRYLTEIAGKIQRESAILPGGILLIVRTGRMDLSKYPQFMEEVFSHAIEQGISKILFNLETVQFDYTAEEQFDATILTLAWFKEHSYWPKVAVLANSTLGRFWLKVAQHQEFARSQGYEAEMFASQREAYEWLRALPD